MYLYICSNKFNLFLIYFITANIIEVRSDDYDACDSSQCAFKNGIEMSEEYLKFTALEVSQSHTVISQMHDLAQNIYYNINIRSTSHEHFSRFYDCNFNIIIIFYV
jgi:hypothetical protein